MNKRFCQKKKEKKKEKEKQNKEKTKKNMLSNFASKKCKIWCKKNGGFSRDVYCGL